MPSKKIHIGDVAVCRGDPPGGNPYLADLIGQERADALRRFRTEGAAEGFTLWYAPSSGGVRPLTPEDVDFSAVPVGSCDRCGRRIYDDPMQILCPDCRPKPKKAPR